MERITSSLLVRTLPLSVPKVLASTSQGAGATLGLVNYP
jgi:hypothetical protein